MDSQQTAPAVTASPVHPAPARRRLLPGCLLAALVVLLALAAIPVLFVFLFAQMLSAASGEPSVEERSILGRAGAAKVAVVEIDGVLLEGLLGPARRQLDKAARDNAVKAVVVRINSPGGSITASDELHRRIAELRDGSPAKRTAAKPVVASMGSMAASGGYYIAMPARTVFAERTTLTGSIGVYASFPNVRQLADKVGLEMQTLKAGVKKDSASLFGEMSPQERQMWQHLIDHSYLQFLQVVEEGRPQLKGKLQQTIVIDQTLPVRTEKGPEQRFQFERYLADGGIWTATQAKEYGLIDTIGTLEDAVQAAAQAAGLGDDFHAVRYEQPMTLLKLLLGQARAPEKGLDPGRLAEAATPRLWYLAPQSELAGLLAAAGRQE